MTTDDKDLAAEVVASHWRAYRKRLRDCREQLNEDSVHKLRISLRRLLALVGLLQYLSPHPQLRKLRKTLKTQLSSLSELRDVQVMRLEISLWVGELPQLQAFLHRLHLRELEILTALPDTLASWRSGKLKRKFNKARRRCLLALAECPSPNEQITHFPQPIAQHAEQLLTALDSANPASFHKLRIAIKKLRYSLELAAPWLTAQASDQAATLKTFQDLLGDLQNDDVLRQHLADAFDSVLPPPLQQRLSENRQQLLATFDSRQPTLSALLKAVSSDTTEGNATTPQSNDHA